MNIRDIRILITVNNEYILISIGIITHLCLCEGVGVFSLCVSIAHFYHIIFHMSSIKIWNRAGGKGPDWRVPSKQFTSNYRKFGAKGRLYHPQDLAEKEGQYSWHVCHKNWQPLPPEQVSREVYSWSSEVEEVSGVLPPTKYSPLPFRRFGGWPPRHGDRDYALMHRHPPCNKI